MRSQVRSQRPMNAETPKELLAAALITPNQLFYIRNHLPVPEVDEDAFRLSVGGEGARCLELSLEELKARFKKHSVTATVQCAGNRRSDLNPGARRSRGAPMQTRRRAAVPRSGYYVVPMTPPLPLNFF